MGPGYLARRPGSPGWRHQTGMVIGWEPQPERREPEWPWRLRHRRPPRARPGSQRWQEVALLKPLIVYSCFRRPNRSLTQVPVPSIHRWPSRHLSRPQNPVSQPRHMGTPITWMTAVAGPEDHCLSLIHNHYCEFGRYTQKGTSTEFRQPEAGRYPEGPSRGIGVGRLRGDRRGNRVVLRGRPAITVTKTPYRLDQSGSFLVPLDLAT